MAPEGLTGIQTSPRERARATTEALAAASGAHLAVEEALDEIDFGDWTGISFEELGGPDWDDWNTRRTMARCPNGEGMAEAADRIVRHMEHLVETRGGERVALVTHADMIRGLVARVLGLSLDNLLRFEIGPASISQIEAGAGWARVLSLNETARAAA